MDYAYAVRGSEPQRPPDRHVAPRLAFAATGLVALVFATGLVLEWRWAVGIWPVSYQGRLAPTFVGSVVAAVGAASLYIAERANWRAALPAGLALLVTSVVASTAFLTISRIASLPAASKIVLVFSCLAVLGAVLSFNAYRYPPIERIRPRMIYRFSFAVFGFVLMSAGLALVAQRPFVFPWRLDNATSVLYGAIFVGLSCNYLYGAIWGTIEDIRTSLIAFLVYDVVLLPRMLGHFGSVTPAFETSLYVYTAVLIYSAALAVYCLALDPGCRIRWPSAPRGAQSGAAPTRRSGAG